MVAAIIPLVAVVGCSSKDWRRPDTSDTTMLKDRLECREEARLWEPDRSTGQQRPTFNLDADRFVSCMTQRGYTYR